MIEETLLEAEEKMEKAVEVAKEDFAGIRTGRATPGRGMNKDRPVVCQSLFGASTGAGRGGPTDPDRCLSLSLESSFTELQLPPSS